jgi:hypothetical protein
VRRLSVDLDEFAVILDQPQGGSVRAFFDRVSGSIESMPRAAEVEGVFDDILASPQRWVEIQSLPKAERRELRWRFVDETVTDPYARVRLFETLEGDGAFVRFEAILRSHGSLIDQWLQYRAATLRPTVRTWLSALGIVP